MSTGHREEYTGMSMRQRKEKLKEAEEKVQRQYSTKLKAREKFLQEQANQEGGESQEK